MSDWKEEKEARDRRRELADKFNLPFHPGPTASARNTTDGCARLDIRRLSKKKLLDGKSHLLPNKVRMQFDGAGVNIEFLYDRRSVPSAQERIWQTVCLEWTACHFGSARPWFVCPNCDRRQAILYVPIVCPVASGYDPAFLCRKCWNILYPSQYVYPRPGPRWAREA